MTIASSPEGLYFVSALLNISLSSHRFVRRAGRFDREICLGVPDQESRVHILSVMCSRMRLSGDFDFSIIAKRTPGMFSCSYVMHACYRDSSSSCL